MEKKHKFFWVVPPIIWKLFIAKFGLLTGGIVMKDWLKKLWKWIWGYTKDELQELIKSKKPELVDLIKKYADPVSLTNAVIDWLSKKVSTIKLWGLEKQLVKLIKNQSEELYGLITKYFGNPENLADIVISWICCKIDKI